jgi:hypothetical protein
VTSRRRDERRKYGADHRGKVSARAELGDQFREAGSKRIREESWDHHRRARHDEASQESKPKAAIKKKGRISKVLDWL